MKTILTTLGISLLVLAGCTSQKQTESNFIQENIDNAVAQETIQTDIIEVRENSESKNYQQRR